MPIRSGQIGKAAPLAAPGDKFLTGKPFRSPRFSSYSPTITGVTKDSTGVALGSCTVQLFRAWDDGIVAETTSDGSGNFTFYPTTSGPYYIVAYKAGAPDVAGTSVNTLVAT